jgi:hypothetical protein
MPSTTSGISRPVEHRGGILVLPQPSLVRTLADVIPGRGVGWSERPVMFGAQRLAWWIPARSVTGSIAMKWRRVVMVTVSVPGLIPTRDLADQ